MNWVHFCRIQKWFSSTVEIIVLKIVENIDIKNYLNVES